MLQIDKTLISLDIFEKKFLCDLSVCKGECCIAGDSGAPLSSDEIKILEQEIEHIYPYMRPEGVKTVKQYGFYEIDWENEPVTTLIEGKECAFVIFDGDIAKCAIEKAYFDKKTTFRKPLSCHLYPIRTKKLDDLEAINYDQWGICKGARVLGMKENVPVYKFLKDPLIRKYGKDWYAQLEYAAENLDDIYSSEK